MGALKVALQLRTAAPINAALYSLSLPDTCAPLVFPFCTLSYCTGPCFF